MHVLYQLAAAIWLLVAGTATWAQVSEYDSSTKLLTIPSVRVGTSTYTDVKLLDTGNFTFVLQSAVEQIPPGPGLAAYDDASGLVTMPAVKVGAATYLDVRLRNLGSFVFTLESAEALPAATMQAVNSLLAQADALVATQVPATGAARFALADTCYRNNGVTRQRLIVDIDAEPDLHRARDAYEVGRRYGNPQVTAVRRLNNFDGSSRQEIDVEYDLVYTDGTSNRTKSTLISGSSAGTRGCTTPQDSSALRFYGNQQLVGVAVRARNQRYERYSIANGAPITPLVQYARRLSWVITDPMGNATYAIVTGPGPITVVNGIAQPFSLKFISTRLLKSAPELQGKVGNFLNWRDDDHFRYCYASNNNLPVASTANCAQIGASPWEWGWTTSNPNAADDSGFASQGWVAGGVYRFDVYGDDGWKTVNGHVGKTPIATYYDTLKALPYTFVEMAGSGTAGDKFHRLNFGALSPAQVQANIVSASPVPLSVTWSRPAALSDGRSVGLWNGWEYHQGPRVGNDGSTFFPGFRSVSYIYPGSTALADAAWNVSPVVDGQARKSYAEFALQYFDREGVQLLSIVAFQ